MGSNDPIFYILSLNIHKFKRRNYKNTFHVSMKDRFHIAKISQINPKLQEEIIERGEMLQK